MMIVRFPNGTSVQYNTANSLSYKSCAWELYTSDGGSWVASIQLSAGAIIEVVPACRVYNATDQPELTVLTNEVILLGKKLDKLTRKKGPRSK